MTGYPSIKPFPCQIPGIKPVVHDDRNSLVTDINHHKKGGLPGILNLYF